MSATLATGVSQPKSNGTGLRLLEGKVAVVYGAAGGVGSAISKGFASEGARLFLTGRTLSPLNQLAAEISKNGGTAEASAVDALDQKAVENHLESVVAEAGRVDVSFNLISSSVGMGHA